MTGRRWLVVSVAALTLGVAVATALASWAYGVLTSPHAGWDGPAVEVVLEPGLDAGTMLERLGDAGVLRHPRLARAWVAWRGGAERLHAGEYRFESAASPVDVLERLERGDVLLHPVTLPEGLLLAEVAGRLADAGFGSTEAFLETFRDPGLVRDLDPVAEDLEGYLFPDTYHFPRGATPPEIVRTLVARFREVLEEDFESAVVEAGLSLREAVILASLIERETSVPDERGHISSVFHNRLERGMRLECDPTVLYAHHRAGVEVERLTYDHLKLDSPWNTYVIQGLPKGPIANPGKDSLMAAVNPIDSDDLYFVASPEGGHVFSPSLAGHLKAVAAWRRYVRSSR